MKTMRTIINAITFVLCVWVCYFIWYLMLIFSIMINADIGPNGSAIIPCIITLLTFWYAIAYVWVHNICNKFFNIGE